MSDDAGQPDSELVCGMETSMKTSTTNTLARIAIVVTVILCTGFPALPAITQAQAAQRHQDPADSFFIVSSVDAKKQQLVLKLPTEVTEIISVTPTTAYRDESGKPLKFADLRAGDTVYVTAIQNAKGNLTAVSIRRAPMTLEELHRRYMGEE